MNLPRLLDGLHKPILKGPNIFTTEKRSDCLLVTYHTPLISLHQRILTDADICDPQIFTVVDESANQLLSELHQRASEDNVAIPPDVELVLELIVWDDDVFCGYYFVEHRSRNLFWLDEFDASDICADIKVVVSQDHLRESPLVHALVSLTQ